MVVVYDDVMQANLISNHKKVFKIWSKFLLHFFIKVIHVKIEVKNDRVIRCFKGGNLEKA